MAATASASMSGAGGLGGAGGANAMGAGGMMAGAGGAASASTGVPLECPDGSLCDTTNGATCSVPRVGASAGSAAVAVCLAAVASLRWLRRRGIIGGALLLALGAARTARAAERPADPDRGPAVDVRVRFAPPPTRSFVIAWNPLPLFTINRLSFDVIAMPVEHHALVLNPFYAWTTTVPVDIYDPTTGAGPIYQVPQQSFKGFGGEIGYRYYFGRRGPRGLFVGPSFIISRFTVTAANASVTPFFDFGGAMDAGYQLLVADRVSLSLGGGFQYLHTNVDIPQQQFPASIYANNGVRPRLLFSMGVAF